MKAAIAAAMIAAGMPALAAETPVIQSISGIIAAQSQTITITGTGFGKHKKYRNKDTTIIAIADNTAKWQAGYRPAGDTVTLSVSQWTDTQITVTGFGGKYGHGTNVLNTGDSVTVEVWNAQSRGKGASSECGLVVGAGGVTC